MHNLIRSFFYSIALLTLFWVSQQPAAEVTLVNWVLAVQNPDIQQISYMLALCIFIADSVMWGVVSAPAHVVGYAYRKTKEKRVRTSWPDRWSLLD